MVPRGIGPVAAAVGIHGVVNEASRRGTPPGSPPFVVHQWAPPVELPSAPAGAGQCLAVPALPVAGFNRRRRPAHLNCCGWGKVMPPTSPSPVSLLYSASKAPLRVIGVFSPAALCRSCGRHLLHGRCSGEGGARLDPVCGGRPLGMGVMMHWHDCPPPPAGPPDPNLVGYRNVRVAWQRC
jgi:hypothetical protein